MKVKELLETLKNIEPEREVIMSKDREGNGFSPMIDWCKGYYHAETPRSGDLYNSKEAAPEGAKEALFLWPAG